MRGELEIIYDLAYNLYATDENEIITKRLRKTNMCATSFKKYISCMLDKGLVTKIGDNYKVTDKGKEYLKTYQIISSMVHNKTMESHKVMII